MTVDKRQLALWVQALSVKAFGFSSWAILVPQALEAQIGVRQDPLDRQRRRHVTASMCTEVPASELETSAGTLYQCG
ncbi:MAG TPA: hypothetical protein VFJ57_13455 [Solirubrobacterales bacterium]|nr:hypothetical protein [Solirubrobacterales bacterium]